MIDRKKAIISAEAFLPEVKELRNLIIWCDLYPTDSWMEWTDQLGHTLKISSDKKIICVIDHYSNRFTEIIKDLYHKANFAQISAISTHAVILFGQENKSTHHLAVIFLLGKDQRLRVCVYSNNEWLENPSPLSFGSSFLRNVCRSFQDNSKKFSYPSRLPSPFPGAIVEGWNISWPPVSTVKLQMQLSSPLLAQTLLQNL